MASISPPSPKPQPDKFSDAMDLLRLAMDPDSVMARLEQLRQAEAHATDALAAADAAKDERAKADAAIADLQRANELVNEKRAQLGQDISTHNENALSHSQSMELWAKAVSEHDRNVAAHNSAVADHAERVSAQEATLTEKHDAADARVAEAEQLKAEAVADREAAKADREKAARILAAAS